MFLMIDNYDSFTYNLVHLFGVHNVSIKVVRNDAVSIHDIMTMKPEGILLSPGPGVPEQAGICVELIQKVAGKVPIFGVCLGMQAIAHAYGGRIVRANQLMHGKTSIIEHQGDGILTNVPSPFEATRYHSLVMDPAHIPSDLDINAHSADGCIMALHHQRQPVYGVQFHPESIASQNGHQIAQNFIKLAADFNSHHQ